MSRRLALLAVLLLAPACATRELPRKPWRNYDLGNVQVLSSASKERSDEIVEKLRRFQVVTAGVTTATVTQPTVPTRIYVFPDLHMYQAITGSRTTAGVAMQRIASNMIALDGSQQVKGDETLLHEYTHLIVQIDKHNVYPAWYNEGLAEVLSTAQFDDVQVRIGKIPSSVGNPFYLFADWIPLRDMFRGDYRYYDDDYRRSQFYAQSWLLVHYAMFAPLERRPDRGVGLEKLLARIQEGEEVGAAAEVAFGVPLQQIEDELRDYARDGSMPYVQLSAEMFRWPTDRIAATSVEPSRVGAHLALLAANFGRHEIATRLAWEAKAAGDASATRELALAIVELEARPAVAYQHFERARAADPKAVEVLALYGWWMGKMASEAEPAEARIRLKKALVLGQEAVAAAPANGAGHLIVGLAALGLGGERVPEAVAALTRSFELWPAHDIVAYNLGVALAQSGEMDRARELFERVARRDHSGAFGRQARERLAALGPAPTAK